MIGLGLALAFGAFRVWTVLTDPQIRYSIVLFGVAFPDYRAGAVYKATGLSPQEVIEELRTDQFQVTYEKTGPNMADVTVFKREGSAFEVKTVTSLVLTGLRWNVSGISVTSIGTTRGCGGYERPTKDGPVGAVVSPPQPALIDVQKILSGSTKARSFFTPPQPRVAAPPAEE